MRTSLFVRRNTVFLSIWLGLCGSHAARAVELPSPPTPGQHGNPYRGDPTVIESGRLAFNTHCSRCHGENASQPSAEAPDLRRLNSFCSRLKDLALRAHCLSDVDAYYLESAREGKVRAGVTYMPPWKDSLSEQTLWQIRSFIEGQPPARPRVRTSVDEATGH